MADRHLRQPGTYPKEGHGVCADEVNAKGGLLGRKIEFVLYDDQSTPATGVKLYEKLITEDNVDAVMAPYSSPISEAVANVTEKYRTSAGCAIGAGRCCSWSTT